MTLESTHRICTQLLIGLFGCFAVLGAGAMDKPEIFVQIGHAQGIYAIAFSPDGHTLASAGGDTHIKLWDASSGRELRTLSGHPKAG